MIGQQKLFRLSGIVFVALAVLTVLGVGGGTQIRGDDARSGGRVPDRAVHRWLGWIALVLGVAAFTPFADSFALLLTLVWITVTSILLAREKSRISYAAARGAALEV